MNPFPRFAARAVPRPARHALLGLALALGSALPAHADLFADNDARRAILELRQQVAQLQQTQQQQAQQIQQVRGALLDLNGQIEQVKGDVAQLRGQQDTTVRQLNQDVAKVVAGQKDLSQRLAPLEPVSVQIDGKPFTVQPAEKAAYDQAMAAFRGSQFDAAASGFKAFIDQYPASPYIAGAQYWEGNSLFALQRYKDAIAAFQALLDDHADNAHAPQAMLGLANCQVELRQLYTARLTLEHLIKRFPNSEAAQTAHARLKKLK